MPLLVAAETPGGGGPITPPGSHDLFGQYTLTAADGTVFPAMVHPINPGIIVTAGATGLDMPPYQVYSDESPDIDGQALRGVRALARSISLPFRITGADRPDFITRKRGLLAQLSPRRGLATLTVAERDGTSRRIGCYSTGDGLEGNLEKAQAGLTWAKYVAVLTAPDPYFTADPRDYVWRTPGAAATWLPVLPLAVAPSQTLDDAVIDNPGDVDAYPIWSLTGPLNTGARFELDGQWWQLDRPVAAGETVTVDCRPRHLSVTLGDGSNGWPDLALGSILWRIPYGGHALNVQYGGATAATEVRLSFAPRYETA